MIYKEVARILKQIPGFFGFTQCLAKEAGTGLCSSYKIGNRFCKKHRGQVKLGIIDINGKKLRDPQVFRGHTGCLAKDSGTGECSTWKYGRFCTRHSGLFRGGVIDKDGNKLRDPEPRTYVSECIAKNSGTGECSSKRQGRFCTHHGSQYKSGIIDFRGKKLRGPLNHPKRTECIAKNSGTGKCSPTRKTGYLHGQGMCSRHFKQLRNGRIDINGKELRTVLRLQPDRKYSGCLAKDKGSGECSKYRDGRWCGKHLWQYRNGVIDKEGNKIRETRKWVRR